MKICIAASVISTDVDRRYIDAGALSVPVLMPVLVPVLVRVSMPIQVSLS